MPRLYKRTFKVDSADVQGEGSFVVFRNLTWDERQARDDDMTVAEAAAQRVVEWNWVDDAGNPIPLPSENPEVLGQLMQAEVVWLVQACNNEEAQKN